MSFYLFIYHYYFFFHEREVILTKQLVELLRGHALNVGFEGLQESNRLVHIEASEKVFIMFDNLVCVDEEFEGFYKKKKKNKKRKRKRKRKERKGNGIGESR